jgi:hypothetical protein
MKIILLFMLSALFASCGYHFESKQLTVRKGSVISTEHNGDYKVNNVTADSIIISEVTPSEGSFRQNWKLPASGRWGGGEPHSLGNNEELQIISIDSHQKTAELELMWLDWVGPLTMPPF